MGLFEVRNIGHLGRVLFGLTVCFIGYNMIQDGPEFYSPFLHAWRRILVPDSKNKISDGLTYQDVNAYVTQFMGALMILGGLLTTLNKRSIGGFLIIQVMLFCLATQDNPYIKEHIKPKPKNMKLRLNDLTRHVTMIGACLYMMVTDLVPGSEEPVKKKKKTA